MDKKIEKKLISIFISLFELDISNINEELKNSKLLGRKFNLQARDLVYLLFEIEKEFEIRIDDEDIINGKFSSINNIIKIISKKVI